jgi:molecular chaperone DnaJ
MSSGKREALLVCAQTFVDPAFRSLRSPSADVEQLAAVLGDESVGAFHVEKLIDRPSHEVRRRIEVFYRDRASDDLLLLYLSGHGLRDELGRLYLFARTQN